MADKLTDEALAAKRAAAELATSIVGAFSDSHAVWLDRTTELCEQAIDAATADLRQRLADVTLLLDLALDQDLSARRIGCEGTIRVTLRTDGECEEWVDVRDGLPVLTDPIRAALMAAKGA